MSDERRDPKNGERILDVLGRVEERLENTVTKEAMALEIGSRVSWKEAAYAVGGLFLFLFAAGGAVVKCTGDQAGEKAEAAAVKAIVPVAKDLGQLRLDVKAVQGQVVSAQKESRQKPKPPGEPVRVVRPTVESIRATGVEPPKLTDGGAQ